MSIMVLNRAVILAYFALMFIAGLWLQDFYQVLVNSWVNYTLPVTINYNMEVNRYTPLVERVVIIAIDSLQPNYLSKNYREIEGFKKIIENGCFVGNIKAIPPTLSTSGRASVITGLPPELAGVLSENYERGTIDVPNLFDTAREKGYRVVVVGDEYIARIARYHIDEYIDAKNDRDAVNKAVDILIKEKPQLLWLGLLEPNNIALEYGVDSKEYAKKLEDTAYLLRHLLFSLEVNKLLNNTLIILLSTHGNTRDGGYGGKEAEVTSAFLLLMGPYVKKNTSTKSSYYITSATPTIASMLGLPSKIPSYSMPIFECLEGKALEQACYYGFNSALNFITFTKSIANYYQVPHPEELRHAESLIRYGFEFAKTIAHRNVTSMLSTLERTYPVIWDGYEKLKESILEEGIEMRLLLITAYITILIVLLYFGLRGLSTIHKLLALGVSLVGYFFYYFYLVYFLKLTPSFSSVVSLENVYSAGREALAPPLIVMLLILALGAISIRSRENPRSYLGSAVASHVLLLVFLSIPVIYVVLFYGYKPRFPPLDPDVTHIFYTNLLYAVNILYFSPLFLVTTLVSITLAKKYLTREVRVRFSKIL